MAAESSRLRRYGADEAGLVQRREGAPRVSFITVSSSRRALAQSPVKELPCMVARVRGSGGVEGQGFAAIYSTSARIWCGAGC